ncbi:TetR/AcrR family transcriptional regulator [Clostridium estertheticum]|uniref:TetR/AcrR family transcriptional regulator n=1 Tax=Clostridium estertheticum TaxID=238834 RepID=UPI001C6EEED0|nr:TetR/AcrR family transcriptional regulator [Clostridium estertheticum]MBW9154486.1 TetR/AcrR family transcriptional regulator [Clostridium estertheticum]WLC86461.1 TetR/AcrR family transcriptional regulator [Clostridium estertheticum]
MSETKRQKQKILTRKHLIEIAIKQFGENGIIATRTADIARAAGVSHGTIFSHFSTQDELVITVIEEFGTRIIQRLHELVDTNSSLFEVLQGHINGLIEFEPFYTKLIIERRLLPESVCNTYIMIQSTISFHISIAAEKEMEQGTIRKMPIHLIYNTWIGLIHYYITNSDLFSPNGSVLKQYSNELLQHCMNLLKK